MKPFNIWATEMGIKLNGLNFYPIDTIDKLAVLYAKEYFKTEMDKDTKEIHFNNFWESKLEIANQKDLTIFTFKYEDETYICEWQKNKWTEPRKITEI